MTQQAVEKRRKILEERLAVVLARKNMIEAQINYLKLRYPEENEQPSDAGQVG